MAWEVRKTSSPSKPILCDRPHPPRSATGGGTSKSVARCLDMSSGSLTWADRVRRGSQAKERRKVDSEEVDGTERERTERKVDGGGDEKVDGGEEREVDGSEVGEVGGGGEGELYNNRVREVDDGTEGEVDDGGMKDENGDREERLGEVDVAEEEGLEGCAVVCEVEGVAESGRKEVSSREDDNGVVECDAVGAIVECAGELVVAEDVHSQDAAEVRNISVV